MTIARVLICGDDSLPREALRAYLDGQDDLEVIATTGCLTGRAGSLSFAGRPDVVLVDCRSASRSVAASVEQVVGSEPKAKVVIVGERDIPAIVEAFEAGAHGYVTRDGLTQPVPGPQFSRTPLRLPDPAPEPGEHTAEILREYD